MHNDDWDRFNLEQLLESAQKAISRSRYVFLVINVAGILMLAEVFNTHCPWIRNTIRRETQKHLEMQARRQAESYTNMANTFSFPSANAIDLLKQVEQSELGVINAPILGINFSAFDLPIIGSVGMMVLALWYVYVLRRENIVIHCVQREACRESKDGDKLPNNRNRFMALYNGVAHRFVFLQTQEVNPTDGAAQIELKFPFLFLQYLPAWVIFVAVLSDIQSLALASYATNGSGGFALWETMFYQERWEAVLRMIFSMAIGFYCLRLCFECSKFHRDTLRVINKMAETEKTLNSPRP